MSSSFAAPAAPAAARLHFIFARDTPVGVILRRGPSKQVRLILWRTDTDTFEPGQWLKGRIYEEMAALSPNGKLLSYSAMDLRKRQRRRLPPGVNVPEATSNWVAVSRPPYLTALALWFYWDGHSGATAFRDDRTLLLGGQHAQQHQRKPLPPPWLKVREMPPKMHLLEDRGWLFAPAPETPETLAARYHAKVSLRGYFEKPIDGGVAVLQRPLYHPYYQAVKPVGFRLRHLRSGVTVPLPDVDYAEVDPAGRLILAKEGKLFAGRISGNEMEDVDVVTTELYDFNAMFFEPVAPPDWARQWPAAHDEA